MYAEVSRYFADERLRAALSFQTMYLGISPFDAPAVYGLLPFTELAHGIWYPDGGLHEIPRALARIAEDLGAAIHYDAAVRRIDVEGGRATGCTLADGRRIAADVVLCNADLPWAYRNLIAPDASRLRGAERLRYTSSAYMMYLGTRQAFPTLVHHNVFFGRDFRGSFEDLFRNHRVPADPSFYVNVAARTDASVAPAGRDGVYVLVPVPHGDARLDWKAEGARLRAHVLARLAACGADLRQAIEFERHVTPDDWAADLNLERGAAFGLSHDFFQVGVFRPANQDSRVRNLFFVGASTQPGTGLPMVLLSARLATERILAMAGVPGNMRTSTRHAA
jgi:phytoene desaturase